MPAKRFARVSWDAATTDDLLGRISEKRQQAEVALNLALGVNLSAYVSADDVRKATLPKEADALTTVSPGQEFVVALTFHNGSKIAVADRSCGARCSCRMEHDQRKDQAGDGEAGG